MRGLSLSQIINGFIGAGLWWYFSEGLEVAGFWVSLFNVVVILALLFAVQKLWRPLVSAIWSTLTYRRPSPSEIVAWTCEWLRREKLSVIAFLWVLTWTVGVLTPLFVLMPYRGQVSIPAPAVVNIALIAVVPWAGVSITFTGIAMWRDWKLCETTRAKVLFGVRLFIILTLTAVLTVLYHFGVID